MTQESGEAITRCSRGHAMVVAAKTEFRENVEEVVHVIERIKHFDREGSEFWTEMKVPDLVMREVVRWRLEYHCSTCGERRETVSDRRPSEPAP
jgi:hypothetical protein